LTYNLDRLYVDKESEEALNSIKNNKTDGAAGITHQALNSTLQFVERLATSQPQLSLDQFGIKLRNFAWHMINIRPTMAPIANAVVLALYGPLHELASSKDMKVMG
jgi:hypothetical protein